MNEKSRKRRIVRRVPPGFYAQPRLHITSSHELEAENCKGISLCTDTAIRLNLGTQDVTIRGDGLRLLSAQKRLLRIQGRIIAVEFSSREEETIP